MREDIPHPIRPTILNASKKNRQRIPTHQNPKPTLNPFPNPNHASTTTVTNLPPLPPPLNRHPTQRPRPLRAALPTATTTQRSSSTSYDLKITALDNGLFIAALVL